MKLYFYLFCLVLLQSCFRFNGRILLQNDTETNLVIETSPIIVSGSGGWENGIHYYNRDSIIWTYSLGNNIKARIIQPNSWKTGDSINAMNRPSGTHYYDYTSFRFDSSMHGIYAMYPNSSFTIGEFNTRKKVVPSSNLNGRFYIRELIIYRGKDTLKAKGNKEIWDLLLLLDKNPENFDQRGERKKVRHWAVIVK